MKPRFPLYAKILFWFFLNLLLLAGAIYLLVRAQFGLGPDWLLAGSGGERLTAVCNVIMDELNDQPAEKRPVILKRFSKAYNIQFYLFRTTDGSQVLGDTLVLPAEVRARLMERPPGVPLPPGPQPPSSWTTINLPPPGSQPRPDPEREAAPDSPRPRANPPMHEAERGTRLKAMLQTSAPTRYWLLVQSRFNEEGRPRPIPVTLIALSESLSGGGFFFDMRPWIAAGLGAILFSALLWLPLVRGITRSIAQMTEATRRIADGHFDVRVDAHRRDELGALGQAINQMAERLAGFVTGQKRFLGDVAHELCSPLARLRMALGILEQRADDQQRSYVDTAADKAAHMADLVNELLSFSKASLSVESIKLKPVPLRDILEKAVRREKCDGVTVVVEMNGEIDVMAEPELMVRAISNLLRNAVRYAGKAGPITLSVKRDNHEVLVTVADCGPGVPEGDLAKIFDPFYRVDSSRDRTTGGVGLGLSIVKTCVESCQGTVSCRNRQPSGLEVTMRLAVVE